MSAKDLALIANVLNWTPRVEPTSRLLLAEAFAEALAATNPRFDRERFLAAALQNDRL